MPAAAAPPARSTLLRAGAELSGRTMRYAELALDRAAGPAAPAGRLVRLGTCDFDFDAAEALFGLHGPSYLDTVTSAVRDIFRGSAATGLQVAVHPWHATAFFTPLPSALAPADRFEQLRQEAALLADVGHGGAGGQGLRIKATTVRLEHHDDGAVLWHHVLRLPEPVHARFAHVARTFGDEDEARTRYEFVDATSAVAALAAKVLPDDGALTLLLGLYGTHAEFVLMRGQTWLYGLHAEVVAVGSAAYFAVALLERLGLDAAAVARLYTYGGPVPPGETAPLEALLGRRAEPLDPLGAFGVPGAGAPPDVLSAYAPVLGALLR